MLASVEPGWCPPEAPFSVRTRLQGKPCTAPCHLLGVGSLGSPARSPVRPSCLQAHTGRCPHGPLPAVQVLPHVLGQDHHQVIDVVVLVGRDAWEEGAGRVRWALGPPALHPTTEQAPSPPWEQRKVWLVMGPGSAKVLNLLSHSRDT